jgi:hypothetical protein
MNHSLKRDIHVIAAIAALISLVIPPAYIGLLGLAPIAIVDTRSPEQSKPEIGWTKSTNFLLTLCDL